MMVSMFGGEVGLRAVPATIANRIYQAGENISSAAKAGDTKAIEKHLAEGADVNGRDPLDGTPLHWAAYQGHTNALKLLIEKGADVNATDLVGHPPLLWATFHGQYEAVELLVKHGADVNPEIDVGGKRTTALETSRDEDVVLAKISSMVHGIKSRKKDSILDGRKKVLKLLEPLAPSARSLKNFSYRFYPGRRDGLPDFKKLKPKKTGKGSGPEVSGIIDLDLVDRSKPFAMEFEGDLEIRQAGKYTFTLGSDDGSRLFVNDEEIIDNDGTHGMQDREGSITLKPGNAGIRVQYFEWGGTNGLSLRVSGPGMDDVRLA